MVSLEDLRFSTVARNPLLFFLKKSNHFLHFLPPNCQGIGELYCGGLLRIIIGSISNIIDKKTCFIDPDFD